MKNILKVKLENKFENCTFKSLSRVTIQRGSIAVAKQYNK